MVTETRRKKSLAPFLVVGVLMAVVGSLLIGLAVGRFSAPTTHATAANAQPSTTAAEGKERFQEDAMRVVLQPNRTPVDQFEFNLISAMFDDSLGLDIYSRPKESEAWFLRHQSAKARFLDDPSLRVEWDVNRLMHYAKNRYISEKLTARELVGKASSFAPLGATPATLPKTRGKIAELEYFAKQILDTAMPEGTYEDEVQKYYPTPPEGVKIESGNLHRFEIDRILTLSTSTQEATGETVEIELWVKLKNIPSEKFSAGENEAMLTVRFK